MTDLKGRSVLVTGAGSDGIGSAVVRTMAASGASVAFQHWQHDDKAKALAHETGAHRFNADFNDIAAARLMVKNAIKTLEGLDILVHCAATLERVPFLQITDDQWERVHKVNLQGAFAVAQEAAKHMASPDVPPEVPSSRSRGRIIMISSVNQQHPTLELAHYVASKGGLMMLARSMALELAETGITVNLVAPGTILTDINRDAFDDPAFRQRKLDLIPSNTIGTPDDVAGAVLYLASDAAHYVTGTTITVDGGLTLP